MIAAVHAKIFSRKFQELFTTVQQCMGNIESDQDTPRKLHQLLHDAVKHVVMRDEAYLAIIKQVSVRQKCLGCGTFLLSYVSL